LAKEGNGRESVGEGMKRPLARALIQVVIVTVACLLVWVGALCAPAWAGAAGIGILL
jgi:hypothetical protein